MHPSSFYDLRARYIYTPLHGPYSLSEALEGLLCYPLNESQDFIFIGSKRFLRHELVSELSNVVDDLHDYLLYFSSTFLISPPTSPDLIRELRASCNGFKYISICWGAIISCLAIARGIVEHNFWPHFFHQTVNNPSAFHGFGRFPSFITPDKSSASTSAFAFTSPSHLDSAPRSQCCPLEWQPQPLNAQNECPEHPRTMPSNVGPTGSKQDRTFSSTLDIPPTHSGSHLTQVPLNCRLPDNSLTSHVPWIFEDRLEEVPTLPKHTDAAHSSCSSTSVRTGDTKGLGRLEDNTKVVRADGQVSKCLEGVTEREEVTRMLYAHLHPIQLTTVQGNTTRGLATVSTRISSSSSISWPSSMSSRPPMVLQPPSTALEPTSTTPAPATMSPPPTASQPMSTIRKSAKMSPPSAVSRFASRAPYISTSTPISHSTSPIPLPHSLVSASSRPSACLPPKGQRTHRFVSSIPFHPPSNSQKRRLKAQPQCLRLSPVYSPTTPPFPRQSLDYYPTYPPLDTFEYDERRTSEGSLLSITVDGDFYQYPASHRLHPSSPFPPARRCVSISPSFRPETLRGRRISRLLPGSPMVSGGHRSPSSTHQLAPSILNNCPSIPRQWQHDSQDKWTSMMLSKTAHSSNAREPGNLKDKAEVGGSKGQDTKEIEVAAGGKEATEVPCARSQPVQLTPFQDITTGELITMSARTSTGSQPSSTGSQPSSMESQLSSMGLQPLSTSLQPSSTTLRPSMALWSSPTAPQFASRGPSIPSSTPSFQTARSTSFPRSTLHPCSFANANSWHPSSKEQRAQRSIPSARFHSFSATQKRLSKVQRRRFVSSPVHLTTPSPFQQPPSFDVHPMYPSSDILQPYQGDQWSPREPPLSSPTLSSVHDVPSVSPPIPSHDLYQHRASLHSGSTSPIFPKRRSTSLSPPFCRRRLSGSQTTASMVDDGSRLPFVSTPLSNNSPSTICQWQHGLQGERSRTSTTPLANDTPPRSFNGSTSGRVRTLSSPTSLSTASNDLCRSISPSNLPLSSSERPCSQPHSRAQSLPANNFEHDEHGHSSPDDENHTFNAERRMFKGPLLSTSIGNASNASSATHNACPVSPPVPF